MSGIIFDEEDEDTTLNGESDYKGCLRGFGAQIDTAVTRMCWKHRGVSSRISTSNSRGWVFFPQLFHLVKLELPREKDTLIVEPGEKFNFDVFYLF